MAAVLDGSAADCPAWTLPQVRITLPRSQGSAVPGRAGSRVSGRPRPVSARVRTAGIRRLPPRAGQPDTARPVSGVAAEPDIADVVAVRLLRPEPRSMSGRLVSAADTSAAACDVRR